MAKNLTWYSSRFYPGPLFFGSFQFLSMTSFFSFKTNFCDYVDDKTMYSSDKRLTAIKKLRYCDNIRTVLRKLYGF